MSMRSVFLSQNAARTSRYPEKSGLSGLLSWIVVLLAKVAELADAPDLGSGGEKRWGLRSPFRTTPSSRCLGGAPGFASRRRPFAARRGTTARLLRIRTWLV